MGIWQSIVKTILTSLLSGLVVVIIAGLLKLRVGGKSLYEILMSRRKVYLFVGFILVLLILLMPVLFSLSRGTLLSPEVLGVYARELLVSVVIVVSFSVTWQVLNHPAQILQQCKALYTASRRAISSVARKALNSPTSLLHQREAPRTAAKQAVISTLAGVSMEAVQPAPVAANPSERNEMELDDTLLALDRGEVDQNMAEKAQQMHALEKWLQGNVVGLYELCEMACFAGGLQPTVRPTVKAELPHMQQIYPAGSPGARCLEQLQLSLPNSR